MGATSVTGRGYGSADGQGHGSEHTVIRTAQVDGNAVTKFMTLTAVENTYTCEPGERTSSGTRTLVVTLAGDITGDVTLEMDTTTCSIGDVLIVFAKSSEGGEQGPTVTLPNNFLVSTCGEDIVSSFDIMGTRYMVYFVFDGEYFLSTFDNC